jgi:hypothetical protein
MVIPLSKIAMTAPVTQQGSDNTWRVRFIMPSRYTMETLPKPNNPAVELKDSREALRGGPLFRHGGRGQPQAPHQRVGWFLEREGAYPAIAAFL